MGTWIEILIFLQIFVSVLQWGFLLLLFWVFFGFLLCCFWHVKRVRCSKSPQSLNSTTRLWLQLLFLIYSLFLASAHSKKTALHVPSWWWCLLLQQVPVTELRPTADLSYFSFKNGCGYSLAVSEEVKKNMGSQVHNFCPLDLFKE